MTTDNETIAIPDPTVERIRALMARKGWGHNETARVLGVPTGTFGNWMQGTKKPNKVVSRLMDIMSVCETFAPGIFDAFVNAKKDGK